MYTLNNIDNKKILLEIIKKVEIDKEILKEVLKGIKMDFDGIKIPLLNKYTEQIIINCNNESISDFKPILRLK